MVNELTSSHFLDFCKWLNRKTFGHSGDLMNARKDYRAEEFGIFVALGESTTA